jgi:hypothetical protein
MNRFDWDQDDEASTRRYCRTLIGWLKRTGGPVVRPSDVYWERHAKDQIIEWLEGIASGGDPRGVIFGSKPGGSKYRGRDLAVTHFVLRRMANGHARKDGERIIAEESGMAAGTVRKVVTRYRREVLEDDQYWSLQDKSFRESELAKLKRTQGGTN